MSDDLIPYDLGPVYEPPGGFRNVFPRHSAGKRLGQMIAAEPELTQVREDEAGQEFIRRYTAYVTSDGADCSSMLTRMERLKFETIVTGKSYAEVLAGLEEL